MSNYHVDPSVLSTLLTIARVTDKSRQLILVSDLPPEARPIGQALVDKDAAGLSAQDIRLYQSMSGSRRAMQ